MIEINKKIWSFLLTFTLVVTPFSGLFAQQNVSVNATKLLARSELSTSPSSGSFVEGTLFDVPILLNTKGNYVNGIQVKVNFDPSRLSIVKPLGGTSIIGVWVEPPSYDNTRGTATYVGVVPNGIKTESGLVGTITFKAKALGRAVVTFSTDSKILLNDGLGTETVLNIGRSEFSVIPKPPGGVAIYSETHPFEDTWYKNKTPVISWDRDSGIDGFSFVLDNVPNTIPENNINSNETTVSFENLSDGLWYFHIKAHKNGVWGGTGHFLIRIDSTPPAKFTPEVNFLVADSADIKRTLLSYTTTDSLSGIDHYEVGVIDKKEVLTSSPVFIQSESPFQIPYKSDSNLHVIVRAVDKAGNIIDESIDVKEPLFIVELIKSYLVYILLFIILIGLITSGLHYYGSHHFLRHIRKIISIAKREEAAEEVKEAIEQATLDGVEIKTEIENAPPIDPPPNIDGQNK